MQELLIRILKYFRMIFLVALIFSVVVLIISFIFKFNLYNTFNYTGIICMVLGFLSIRGNMSMTKDLRFFNLDVSSKKSIYKNARDDLNLRDSSFNFLIFMGSVGIILIMISKILRNYI